MAAVGSAPMVMPPVPDAHAVRDVLARRIADGAAGDEADGSGDDRARERAHRRIAHPPRLRLRRPRAERERRDDDADTQLRFHDFPDG